MEIDIPYMVFPLITSKATNKYINRSERLSPLQIEEQEEPCADSTIVHARYASEVSILVEGKFDELSMEELGIIRGTTGQFYKVHPTPEAITYTLQLPFRTDDLAEDLGISLREANMWAQSLANAHLWQMLPCGDRLPGVRRKVYVEIEYSNREGGIVMPSSDTDAHVTAEALSLLTSNPDEKVFERGASIAQEMTQSLRRRNTPKEEATPMNIKPLTLPDHALLCRRNKEIISLLEDALRGGDMLNTSLALQVARNIDGMFDIAPSSS